MNEFHAYGAAHVGVLVATGVLVLVSVVWARSGKWAELRSVVERVVGVGLILTNVGALRVAWLMEEFTVRNVLPFHLCDIALILGAVALFRPRIGMVEVLYYWGLAGTAQGLLTPVVPFGPGHLGFWTFFGAHSGIVVVAIYLVAGRGFVPRAWSWWRVFILSQLYLLVMLPFDLLTGANYGYFREKPMVGTLLDAFGPWPYYIVGMEIVALVAFFLLYLPWRGAAAWRAAAP